MAIIEIIQLVKLLSRIIALDVFSNIVVKRCINTLEILIESLKTILFTFGLNKPFFFNIPKNFTLDEYTKSQK